jgi:hypothetical protein
MMVIVALPRFYSSCAHKGFADSCITSIVINGILSEKTRLNKGKIY